MTLNIREFWLAKKVDLVLKVPGQKTEYEKQGRWYGGVAQNTLDCFLHLPGNQVIENVSMASGTDYWGVNSSPCHLLIISPIPLCLILFVKWDHWEKLGKLIYVKHQQ
jgi:hypothetical protein